MSNGIVLPRHRKLLEAQGYKAPPKTEPNYNAEMALPVGKTCAHCRHIKRCAGFGFSTPERTSCDFYPSRFGEAP